MFSLPITVLKSANLYSSISIELMLTLVQTFHFSYSHFDTKNYPGRLVLARSSKSYPRHFPDEKVESLCKGGLPFDSLPCPFPHSPGLWVDALGTHQDAVRC